MAVIGIDIGASKIRSGVCSDNTNISLGPAVPIEGATGEAVAELIILHIRLMITEAQNRGETVSSAGIAVPGIWNEKTGTGWIPAIPGWDNFPLLQKLQEKFPLMHFYITSARFCAIWGETWKGKTARCRDAIFFSAGDELAAGIMVNGEVLPGSAGAAGAIGWMALNQPFEDKYILTGCNQYYASEPGLVQYAGELLDSLPRYKGIFRTEGSITAKRLIDEYENGDKVAVEVLENAIRYWGMTVANLVSLFNPEMIVLGGELFHISGCRFLEAIRAEAIKWSQPVSMHQVKLECSELGHLASLYGVIYYALQTGKIQTAG